jgi:hypothetical protein
VGCNVENERSLCYQATCLDLQSDWPHPNGGSYVPECGHKCCEPVMFAERV